MTDIALARPTRRGLLTGFAAGAALPIVGATAQAATPAEVFGDADVPVLGNPRGDVAIAVWFDYQCPWCKKIEPVMMDVVRKDGRVAVLLKDWPIFGKVSDRAARLVWSARRQDRLAALHAALMALPGRATDAALDTAVGAAKLDAKRLAADVETDRPAFDRLVARNGAQADGFGFPGTPAYVIGSFVFGGVLDADGFAQAIADTRAKNRSPG